MVSKPFSNLRLSLLSIIAFSLISLSPYTKLFLRPSLELPPKPTRPRPLCTSKQPLFQNGTTLIENAITSAELRNLTRSRVHFLTYGDKKFQKSLLRIQSEARQFNMFSSILMYDRRNLSLVVRGHFADVLNRTRGGGYWIWKPLVIRDALERVKYGDYVLYADAGCTLNKHGIERLKQYMLMIKRSRFGILSIAEEYPERRYTSGHILETFGVRENAHFLDSPHYWAGMLIMQKRKKVLQMIDMVIRLLYMDRWMFTDAYRFYKAVDGFEGNRHDQSVLSVIRKCWGSVQVGDLVKEKDSRLPVWASRIRE